MGPFEHRPWCVKRVSLVAQGFVALSGPPRAHPGTKVIVGRSEECGPRIYSSRCQGASCHSVCVWLSVREHVWTFWLSWKKRPEENILFLCMSHVLLAHPWHLHPTGVVWHEAGLPQAQHDGSQSSRALAAHADLGQ